MAWGRPAGAGISGEEQREHQRARPHPWVAEERREAAGSSLAMAAEGGSWSCSGGMASRRRREARRALEGIGEGSGRGAALGWTQGGAEVREIRAAWSSTPTSMAGA